MFHPWLPGSLPHIYHRPTVYNNSVATAKKDRKKENYSTGRLYVIHKTQRSQIG